MHCPTLDKYLYRGYIEHAAHIMQRVGGTLLVPNTIVDAWLRF